ncbi:VPLPA-CTERM sorting domain-containing protein [Gymnodinialimonas sp. 2307UL20-7]
MFFGNDDFNYIFDAVLEVFDINNAPLGSVRVGANRNDFADQFIGLRSDTAIGYGAIHYSQPGARNLRITIDDLTIGADAPPAVIPLPASLPLLLAGIAGLGLWRRRRPSLQSPKAAS